MYVLSAILIFSRFFRVEENIELKVVKRGCLPKGGGQVNFKCRVANQTFRPLQVTDQGKIKRVRGTAWAARVSPAVANRMVEAAKGVLLNFLTDVYIYTDHRQGAASGESPGFGMTLTAETTTGAFLSADVCSSPKEPGSGKGGADVPEDMGKLGANMLLEEVYRLELSLS